MANRFRSQTKTKLVQIHEPIEVEYDADSNVVEPTEEQAAAERPVAYEFEIRYMGHGAIVRRVMAYEGLDIVIEDAVDTLMKLPAIKKMVEKSSRGDNKLDKAEVATAIMADLANSPISLGGMASRLLTKAPDLIVDLAADSIVLEGDETAEDFVQFFDTWSISQIVEFLVEWYRFNFVGGLRPLVQEVAGLFGMKPNGAQTRQDVTTEAKTATAASRISHRPFRRAGA